MIILITIYGLIIGSFINALLYRLEEKKTILGRSFCPNCKKQIRWYDLFPVISWIVLGGKCRDCNEKISIQYPLVELATGATFGILGYYFLILGELNFFNLVNLLFWLIFSSCLIAIFVYDAKHRIIPDEIIYTGIIVGFFYILFNTIDLNDMNYLIDHILSAVISGLFFYVIAIASLKILKKEGMGGGDVKLAFFMGLILGWKGVIIALYAAFLVSALLGIILIVFGKKKMSSKIAFGPFLIIGTFISLFIAEKIISFYVNIFI